MFTISALKKNKSDDMATIYKRYSPHRYFNKQQPVCNVACTQYKTRRGTEKSSHY